MSAATLTPELANDAQRGTHCVQRVVRMRLMPITLEEANAYVKKHHRHHKPTPGHKYSVAVGDTEIRGVAIVGRPVARKLDDGWTLEVNRVCTDGARNACSMLYQAAWRAAKALGYTRLITYTLPKEGGASLRGAGWKCLGERGGGNWNVPSRPRVNTDEILRGQKWLWQAS
jgi:hypothetical protein